MKNKIVIAFIISLHLTSNHFAYVTNIGNEEYEKDKNNQFVTKEEVYDYYKEMQKWADSGANITLLQKVASRSEAHGYIREEK